MCPACVNSDYASKCANQLAAGARVHAAQISQGADIRHTPHMSAFKIDDQRCEVAINVQQLVTNQHCMSHGRLRVCVCACKPPNGWAREHAAQVSQGAQMIKHAV
jgi:hypothetical protein